MHKGRIIGLFDAEDAPEVPASTDLDVEIIGFEQAQLLRSPRHSMVATANFEATVSIDPMRF